MWKGRISGESAGMEAMMSGLQEQLRYAVDIQRQRAELTVSAATPDMRITATVDAEGHLIDLEFSDDIGKMSHAEIAGAVLATTRQAVEEVNRRTMELMEPFEAGGARIPTLEELFEGFPEVLAPLQEMSAEAAGAPDVEVVSENSAQPWVAASQVVADPDEVGPLMEFDGTVELATSEDDGSAVRENGWV